MADEPPWVPNAVQLAGASATLAPTGADDTAAILNALLNWPAPFNGPKVVLLGGTYNWSVSVPQIQRSFPAAMLGAGVGNTIIKLNADGTNRATRFVDLNKIADGDTFKHIEIAYLTIDNNNVATTEHVLFGTLPANVVTPRINLDDINIHDYEIINVPNTSFRKGVGIAVGDAAAQATQYTITNVKVQRWRQFGGRIGVHIVGVATSGGPAGLNIFIDGTRVTDWWHDVGITPTGFATSDHVQIGSNAQVGFDNVIARGYGRNCTDQGIEVDNVLGLVLEDITIEDSWTSQFGAFNFTTPGLSQSALLPNAQKVTFRNCTAKATNVLNTVGAFVSTKQGGLAYGEIVLENCRYIKEINAAHSNSSGYGYALQIGSGTAHTIRGLRVNGLDVTDEGWTYTSASSIFLSWIQLTLVTAAAPVPTVSLNDLDIMINGAQGSTGFVSTGEAIKLNGDMVHDHDGCDLDSVITGQTTSGTFGFCKLGNTTSIQRGTFRRWRLRRVTTSDAASVGFNISATGTLTITDKLYFQDCDFSQAAAGITEFKTNAQPAGAVIVEQTNWKTYPKPRATQAVGGSPWTYQNGDLTREKLIITGGTVSNISYSRDNATFDTIQSATGADVDLDPGDYLQVTYSVLPTAVRYTRR